MHYKSYHLSVLCVSFFSSLSVLQLASNPVKLKRSSDGWSLGTVCVAVFSVGNAFLLVFSAVICTRAAKEGSSNADRQSNWHCGNCNYWSVPGIRVYISHRLHFIKFCICKNWLLDLSICPGFSWDRVNFLSSSWYSAMSSIQYEKNVDNTLMFSVVAK